MKIQEKGHSVGGQKCQKIFKGSRRGQNDRQIFRGSRTKM